MEDPCALQIKLYYDDLEVCNALGSKIKKHKLGMLISTLCVGVLYLPVLVVAQSLI